MSLSSVWLLHRVSLFNRRFDHIIFVLAFVCVCGQGQGQGNLGLSAHLVAGAVGAVVVVVVVVFVVVVVVVAACVPLISCPLMMSMSVSQLVIVNVIIQSCCIQRLLNPPILLIFAEEGLWYRTFMPPCAALSTGGSWSYSDILILVNVFEPVVEHGIGVVEQCQQVLDQNTAKDRQRPCRVDVVVQFDVRQSDQLHWSTRRIEKEVRGARNRWR